LQEKSFLKTLSLSDWLYAAAIAAIVALVFYLCGAGRTYNEGLPPMSEILQNDHEELVVTKNENINLSTWQIFTQYIVKDINVWFVSFIDVFTYMIRFGVLTWLPLYLLETKGFTKKEMALAFAIFEWAAIPSTLLAGYVTDTYFKGKRMPLSMMTLVGVGLAIVALRVVPLGALLGGIEIAANPPFPMLAAVTGLLAAAGVGALSGIIPAIVAVRIRPIDATRH